MPLMYFMQQRVHITVRSCGMGSSAALLYTLRAAWLLVCLFCCCTSRTGAARRSNTLLDKTTQLDLHVYAPLPLRLNQPKLNASHDSTRKLGTRRSLGQTSKACKDILPFCGDWASGGYCADGYTHEHFDVKTYWCPKSCNSCGSEGCVDLMDVCSAWASQGKCSALVGNTSQDTVANLLCMRSCGKCSKGPSGSSETSGRSSMPLYHIGPHYFAPPSSGSGSPGRSRSYGGDGGSYSSWDSKIYLKGSNLEVAIDKDLGGMVWMAPPNSHSNLINQYDRGRYIQGSYYGDSDGSLWGGQPWYWNAVQLGSWQNQPARVEKVYPTGDNGAYVEVTPRNWAGQQLLEEARVIQQFKMYDGYLHINTKLQYWGSHWHQERNQELPAVFLSLEYSQLWWYTGGNPWSWDSLQSKTLPPISDGHHNIMETSAVHGSFSENWAAYINPSTGQGVGVYSPRARFFTAYRCGPVGDWSADCNYIAPVDVFSVSDGSKTQYDAYFIYGSLEEIRRTVYRLAGKQ